MYGIARSPSGHQGNTATLTNDISDAEFQTEVVGDIRHFNSMAGEWDRLVDASGADRVFLSHHWFRTWWEAFGANNELHVVTVRSGGELVAAAPMMCTRASIYGVKLNAIQSIYNPHTPRFDFLVRGGDTRLYRALWREISATPDADMILLAQVPEGSATPAAIEGLAKDDGWITGRWIAPASPYIPLGRDYDTLFSNLKRGFRYNLRSRYQRLRKVGKIDVEVLTDRESVREALNEGLRIEAAAWKGEHGTAILSDPNVEEFYSRLAEREADRGQMRLTFLRVGGKRISFNYLVRCGTTLYGVKIGYDPEYYPYSPGNMLLNLILKDACAAGICEYDFLGADDEWKFDWTKERREHRWLFLFRNALRPRFARYLKFGVAPAVKPGMKALCTYLRGLA